MCHVCDTYLLTSCYFLNETLIFVFLVQQLSVDLIARELPGARTSLQCAMCHLLNAIVSSSFATHSAVAESGLVPHMVSLCRSVGSKSGTRVSSRETHTPSQYKTVILAHRDWQLPRIAPATMRIKTSSRIVMYRIWRVV